VGVVQELQTQSGPPPPWDQSGGRNAEVQWHGQKRSNDNHASPTDPEVRLYRKSSNIAATLCYSGHLLMENRSALIVDAELTSADGYAERAAAVEMLGRLPTTRRRRTVAGDKGYDTAGFVDNVRELGFHAACHENSTNRRSAIDGRTTRHRGHQVTMRIRKRIAEPFRLDQDDRWWPQAARHRPRTQPRLVQDHRRRLQPHQNHRTRHPTRLSEPSLANPDTRDSRPQARQLPGEATPSPRTITTNHHRRSLRTHFSASC
jgi:hypothetical protein